MSLQKVAVDCTSGSMNQGNREEANLEKDYFKKGLPLYSIHRYCDENGEPFRDGSHIIYVNGSYKGDDKIGKLMHDFRCKNPKKMYNKQLAKDVKHYKEEGGNGMSEALEKFAIDYAKRHLKQYAEEYVEEYARDYAKKHAKEYAEEYAKEYAEEYARDYAQRCSKEVAIRTTVEDAVEYNVGRERVLERLCSKFLITMEEAEKAFEEYGKVTT